MDRKFPMQQCQDEKLTESFRKLHVDVVNMIIKWCKNNNVVIDEFHLNADGVADSIPYGEWKSCTDSGLTFEKFTGEYKDVVSLRKHVDENEWKRIKLEQKHYLFSI